MRSKVNKANGNALPKSGVLTSDDAFSHINETVRKSGWGTEESSRGKHAKRSKDRGDNIESIQRLLRVEKLDRSGEKFLVRARSVYLREARSIWAK